MREENVASLQTYDRRRTMSFSGPKVFDMRHENAASYQTCGRRRAVPFSRIRRILRIWWRKREALGYLE
jgi:hypothetical protein